MNEQNGSPRTYSAYAPDVLASSFGPLTSFINLWQDKSPSAEIFPQWRDFQFMDFDGWWGQISLAEIHTNPLDFRWALWGTKITDWWGVDYTNKYISDIPEVRDVWENFEKPYIQRIIDDRLIGYVFGTLSPQGRDFKHICGIDLPLEKDGNITHILSAYHLCDPSEALMPTAEPIFRIEMSA